MTQGWCIIGNVVVAPGQAPTQAIFYATEPVITYHSNSSDQAYWGYAYTQFNGASSFADGTYTISESDQASCSLTPPTYDCVACICTPNTAGTGAYNNLAACLANCACYDSINGVCTANTTYATPGHYTSIEACNAAIASPTCPACPTLPCASCPTGQTCQDSTGEEVNFVNISAPTFSGNCDSSGNPVFGTQSVTVISGTESSELLKFQELAQIKGAAVCNIDVAACPDGWLIRPEYHRPQVIYQFAEIDHSGNITGAPKYPITVPHHISTKPDDALPNYKRGNWEIIYVLKDNSKVTIHSFDEDNGMTMLNAIKLRITPSYLDGAYLSKSCLVVTDTDLAQITVKNRMAKYYSFGTKNALPDWVAKW
ncbi:MAG: hypothetical protein V7L11_07155 [Nostoc sp.]|uniref:hypothetical protein n=1 Tax=Nostoc sp. TaxID=1180 RepID=UPI002FF67F05